MESRKNNYSVKVDLNKVNEDRNCVIVFEANEERIKQITFTGTQAMLKAGLVTLVSSIAEQLKEEPSDLLKEMIEVIAETDEMKESSAQMMKDFEEILNKL